MKIHIIIVWLAAAFAASLLSSCSRHGAGSAVIGSWQGAGQTMMTFQKDGALILKRPQQNEWRATYRVVDSTHLRFDIVTSDGTKSSTYIFSVSEKELTLQVDGSQTVEKFQRAPD